MTTSVTLILLLALAAVSARAHGDCELPIRRGRVLSAWQSSFELIHAHGKPPNTCFYNRSQEWQDDEQATLHSQQLSYKFFHSANRSQADGGFHWFAVQLNEPVLIRSVSVKGREDGATFVFERARGIEIWTSNSSRQMFSGDHCSSRNMSRQFRESQQHWRLCGVTESKNSPITAGEILTVRCKITEARQLLLRRNITVANDSSYHDFMSFSDLRLHTVQLEISASTVVAESSGLTVTCSLSCNGSSFSTNSSDLKLCGPNGSCWDKHEVQILEAKPEHAGNYTCRIGSVQEHAAVAVLSSSVSQLVEENSTFTVSCWLHCSRSVRCVSASRLQLCLPNGSCVAKHEWTVARSRPMHAGNYTCKRDSVEKQTSVEVLDPPSNARIDLWNYENCTRLSDAAVQFASSAAYPVPEHRCIANSSGAVVRNLTLQSVNSSQDGSVTLWKLVHDDDFGEIVQITCTATQQLPQNISFDSSSQDSVQLNCSLLNFLSDGLATTILFVVILSACTALIGAAVLLMVRSSDHESSAELNIDSACQQLELQRVVEGAEEAPVAGAFQWDSEPECSYLTVAASADEAALQLRDSASNCTEFIEIQTDGD